MNKSLFAAAMLSITANSWAEAVSKSHWGDKAIGSHDTVAYHDEKVMTTHQEVKGNERFIVKYSGANWYFASQTSADKFKQNPEKYKPVFNGYCANALSLGEGLINTDGSVWEFFDDQLHLFYAERGRQRWLQGDWQNYRQQADKAWLALKDG